ncbi:hypothetical protein QBC36DRAFT_304565 [Triangularia setosa]|uniref:Uncharacterized protein n=1 Tax=Triangularia setosa TaxID=2587417 RepID=A0AAN7A3X9_9PEZI|nr:hypothetical protein QBC36DRAFT_304565 [Podospora setosa]
MLTLKPAESHRPGYAIPTLHSSNTNSLIKMPAAIAYFTDSLHGVVQICSRKRLDRTATVIVLAVGPGAILAVALGSEVYDVSG